MLETLDADALAQEHFKMCQYQINGYWDERDIYYEIIILPSNLVAHLVSSSIGITNRERFIQLKFSLVSPTFTDVDTENSNSQKIGDLVLVYDENLEFIDENWLLDINSPFVVALQRNQILDESDFRS